MPESVLSLTANLIQKDFPLELPENGFSEEKLRQALGDYVAWALENDMERFFSILYIIDVSEAKIEKILSPEAAGSTTPANIEIAELIIARLKQKAISRMASKNTPTEADSEDELW